MALSQTSSRPALSMTGTGLVPQLGNTNGDRRRAAENAFDACVTGCERSVVVTTMSAAARAGFE
jgi:hypothetical protein